MTYPDPGLDKGAKVTRCARPGCDEPKRYAKGVGYCSDECQEAARAERFWAKVNKTPLCWLWSASLTTYGYGQFNVAGRPVMAHIVAWRLIRGDVPEGLELDHLCRNRACVRPSHLEPVTHQENILRGLTGTVNARRQLALTHCKHAHEFTPANTYWWRGTRHCRACSRSRQAAYRATA